MAFRRRLNFKGISRTLLIFQSLRSKIVIPAKKNFHDLCYILIPIKIKLEREKIHFSLAVFYLNLSTTYQERHQFVKIVRNLLRQEYGRGWRHRIRNEPYRVRAVTQTSRILKLKIKQFSIH